MRETSRCQPPPEDTRTFADEERVRLEKERVHRAAEALYTETYGPDVLPR